MNSIQPGCILDFNINIGNCLMFDRKQQLTKSSLDLITKQIKWLNHWSDWSIILVGYPESYSASTASKRVNIVKEFFIARGIDSYRISIKVSQDPLIYSNNNDKINKFNRVVSLELRMLPETICLM